MGEYFNIEDLSSVFVGTFYATILSITGLFTIIAIILSVVGFSSGRAKRKNALVDKHVLITGGSSGIGRSVAIEAASRGANVTIIARNQTKLNSVKQDVINACMRNSKDQAITPTVQAISLDVTSDYDLVEKTIKSTEEVAGPIFMLVNCAGTSLCNKFEDTTMQDFKHLLDLNFLGTVQASKSVVVGMKSRGSGHIIITASQGALVGIYGYTAYSSTKFALRGFAETLHMELKPYGINVTLSLPPDTDTPGFEEEEKSKLQETRLICQTGGLVNPDVVASQLLDDAIMGRFFSTVGFEGKIMTILCAGMSPFTSVLELILQVSFMGILRLIGVGYLISFENIIRKCMKSRNKAKKSE